MLSYTLYLGPFAVVVAFFMVLVLAKATVKILRE